MNFRKNAGYIITDSIHVGEIEFVLGVHTLTAALDGTFIYPDVVDKTKELLEQPEHLEAVIGNGDKTDFPLFFGL